MDTTIMFINLITIGIFAIVWNRADKLNVIIKIILSAIALADLIYLGRMLGFIIKI